MKGAEKNHKAKGFLSKTGLDPLKITATKPAFHVEPLFQGRFAGGPIMVRF